MTNDYTYHDISLGKLSERFFAHDNIFNNLATTKIRSIRFIQISVKLYTTLLYDCLILSATPASV